MLSKLIKLPVAKLGSWFHESLGVISFSQSDLDDIKRNFEDNARGYEPYVRYGHHERGPGVFQGERALAYCVHMAQEGDVLWGYFKPVDAVVLEEIEQEHYRYSSSEFIKNARDRETNAPLGRLLLGVALTNSPSVPWLPRNTVVQVDTLALRLSDDLEPLAFPMELENSTVMMSENDTPSYSEQPEQETEASETEQMAEAPAAQEESQPNLLMRTLAQLTQFMQRIETVLSKQGELAQMPENEEMQSDMPQPEAPTEEASEAEVMEQEALSEAAAPEAVEAEEEAKPEEAMPESEPAPEEDKEEQEESAEDEMQARLMAAEAALQAAQAELAAKAEEAQKLEKAYKDREFALMLSDRVKAVVAQGVPPAAAEKAAQLVNSLHTQAETLMLSDRQVSLVDAVFELLSDHPGTVSFEQAGTVEANQSISVNPWLKRTEGLKAQAAAK